MSCLSKCIFRRRTVVTGIDINYPRSSVNPDSCQWTDAVTAAALEKVKRKYEKTEDGTCSGDCHCVRDVDAQGNPKPEEGPAKEILEFTTTVRIDTCTYNIVGTFNMETFDTPGRCHPNGGEVKMSHGRLPGSDMTITVENYDNISRDTLAKIGDLLKKGGKK